uniref:Uncharacterized protein n=1 Tax=viral metagenome TaxID=1070528 RepID=A0A6C0KQX5_9ZZZZ
MPKKIVRSNKKRINNKKSKTMKNMIGCSKKKNKTFFKSLGKKSCPNCGPNCRCGPNCNCGHNCPGTCYMKKGGSGCGSCGCPIAPLSWNQMNKFGGNIDYGKTQYPAILGSGQNGGTCNVCTGQNGGNFFKPASSIPGPIVGQSWGPSVSQWPGMDGVGANRNYLAPIGGVINNDPALQMTMNDAGYTTLNSMVGGYLYDNKKKMKNKTKLSSKSKTNSKTNSNTDSSSLEGRKGGGLIPQDLLNLGSDITYNVKSAYNALNGYSSPVNPLPYKDQFSFSNN